MRVLTRAAIAPDPVAERARFAALRRSEFPGLDARKDVYLDYTGAALYARSQIDRYRELLGSRLIGNPHSEHPASRLATELIERARDEVLRFFRADAGRYVVVFTANASHAVKLVGESFPFRAGSRLVLTQDNHNSVNGLRRYAEARGARLTYLALGAGLRLRPDAPLPRPGRGPSLFAFPAQSNFSGARFPLALVRRAQRAGYRVLLDAAALVPTSPLDLSRTPADFVPLSFYKMFGFPTGIGALLARRDALAELERPWFAGGTVDFVSVRHRLHQLRSGAEAFEDGTPNFLGIAGVPAGLEFLRGVGMDAIGRHVERLIGRVLEGLAGLAYDGGRAAALVYGPTAATERGGTVAFNLLARDGRVVPYQEVERAAGAAGVHLRGGCFCNPGAAEAAFGFPPGRARRCFAELAPGSFEVSRLASCLGGGVAVGAIRASVGVASSDDDVNRLLEVLRRLIEARPVRREPA